MDVLLLCDTVLTRSEERVSRLRSWQSAHAWTTKFWAALSEVFFTSIPFLHTSYLPACQLWRRFDSFFRESHQRLCVCVCVRKRTHPLRCRFMPRLFHRLGAPFLRKLFVNLGFLGGRSVRGSHFVKVSREVGAWRCFWIDLIPERAKGWQLRARGSRVGKLAGEFAGSHRHLAIERLVNCCTDLLIHDLVAIGIEVQAIAQKVGHGLASLFRLALEYGEEAEEGRTSGTGHALAGRGVLLDKLDLAVQHNARDVFAA
mmetsp:Transcript_4884/g.15471  ORF Transcript_4884/g.15471 Transcript_4884/m.15471 type:complete len:258 (-) Transcript_4884:479-1252(-)